MLKKQFRLAKTADVQRVFAQGRAFFNPLFIIKYPFSKTGRPRFTVVVSTKVSKKAVDRNRIKRVLREFLRLTLDNFKTGDYAVVVKPAAAKITGKELVERFSKFCYQSKLVNL